MTSTKWMCSAAVALTLGLPACDVSDAGTAGEAGEAVHFRNGDGTWGPGKLNTNFLGEDEAYPLNALPLVDDPAGSVRLHAVWSTRCVDRLTGKTHNNGLFYASGSDGGLGIGLTAGELDPARFQMVGKDVTCTVASNDWEETVWDVTAEHEGNTSHFYLMILDRGLDENDNPVYRWGVFIGNNAAERFNPSQYKPTCVEDIDPFNTMTLLRHHAYLVADLGVDPISGDFSEVPDTMYLACRSGAVGKAISWNYAPWDWGSEIHELSTRVVRADYCGDGKSYTEKGNALQVRDQLGVSSFTKPFLKNEAAWDLATSKATCVTMPRDHERRVGFTGITCGNKVLPSCSFAAMNNALIATKVAD